MNASRLTIVAVAVLLLTGGLAGCAGESGGASSSGSPSPSASSSASPEPLPGESASPAASESPSPTPTPPTELVAIPDDCRAILSADVLAQLDGVPLNDPAIGPSGMQPDGSLLCVWRDPRADTTALSTKISYMSRGPALNKLNALAASDGFTCFTPDGGTRCEKTWANGTYPVTDGRTLFWRDDVLIDTSFSNLAPSAYTSSIVAYLFG